MKLPTCALLFALLLALILLSGALARPTSDFNLWWRVVASGGGNSISSIYAASGSIGQPAVGASSGGDYRLGSGYWYAKAVPAPPPMYHLYLPGILRSPP